MRSSHLRDVDHVIRSLVMKALALFFLLCYFNRISVVTGIALCLLYYLVEAVLEHQVHRISALTAVWRLGELRLAENATASERRQQYMFNV